MALIKGKQLADSAISSAKIADLSITTAKIAAEAIIPSKMDLTSQTYDFSSATLQAGTPSNNTDVANKAYVDSVAGSGLEVKQSVRAIDVDSYFDNWTYSSSSLTLTSPTSTLNVTIDGVAVVVGNRVLVQSQSTQTENGVYTLTATGDGNLTSFVLTRAGDFDATADISANNFFFVEEGTNYKDTGWVLTTNETITLDSSDLTFQQFSGAGSITAGNGLSKSGDTLSVAPVSSHSGLSVSASGIKLDHTTLAAGSISSATTPRYFGFDGTNNVQFSIGTILNKSLPTANGFLGSAGVYSVRLNSTGGLELNSGEFRIKKDGNSLTSDSNGLSVQLNSENSVSVTSTGLVAPVLRTDRLGQSPSAVSSSTGTTGLAIPSGITVPTGGAVSVFVNGIKANLGAATSSQCFFSADSGSSARALNAIVAGDVLYWNPAASGSYDLETSDVVDIIYASLTA
tara:strand:+ start:3931 stop:5301 length:1371 start_codon:yes stop_codon:yes gene_type:complete